MPRAACVSGNPLVYADLGKMAMEDETDNCRSEGGPSLGGSVVQSEEGQKDRESINPDGTKGNRKDISSGESSGKVGGSKQGTQETREGRNKDRSSARNSDGAVSKKARIMDARHKLAEIEKRTAEYKARLIEEMMIGNEEDLPQEEPPDERKVNFILESDGRDRVNATTRLGTAERRIIRDTMMEEVAGGSATQAEPEIGEQEKVYGKPREEEPTDKVTAAKKKFRYQIPILTMPEIDDTLSKLLGTMVSVSLQTMLQVSPRLLKGHRQLLTRRRVEIDENPESREEEKEEEAPQEVANLQRSPGDMEDLEKAFADIRLSLPDCEGGEVMRAPHGTKLSFHALPVGKLKVQIGTHHTNALVDGGEEITLIRRDLTTITGCVVNKEVMGNIREAGGEIPFSRYVNKCAVKAGIRESIWSFQRMTVLDEMDHDIILGRPWCGNVEMIGMHLHDGTYMVDLEDSVTGRGKLLRLIGTGGDPPKGKLATWSPSLEDSARKGAFAQMEDMRERVEIMIEEAFNKKEWIKMGLPQKKRRQEDEILGIMVAERE
ncbi:hypothetical protein CBR_g17631 [Chara braunii]|uniref:Peptidase A2 domain-containing protein n=1 Tax=Chara braunii TaxID=69332 RepID=A0A388KV33_CHABU|nr:hypothetical protein CBR_g17631 [Chara braunii]|eukprot:GBG73916.1 hypothetical protein CBR_g17631 [Chara braunii]